MYSLFRSMRGPLGKGLALSLIALSLLIGISACGGTSSNKVTIIVGGKLDTEGQILTTMYVLLLRQAGYNVVDKAAL
ncbi:MAG TPA: hypothetical protein VKQ36_13835, partial [Ktedonobacterales bacterium]|nr:hypothetical protein [Ktedonobacterales bacterium]